MVTDNAMKTKTPWWRDTTPIAWKWIFLFGFIAIILIVLADYALAGDEAGYGDPESSGGWSDVGTQTAVGATAGGMVGARSGTGGAAIGAVIGGAVGATEEIMEQTIECGGICGGGIDYQDGSSVGAIEGSAAESALNQGSHPRE
jgi:hypothetical protein